jgi:hypothetical protein
MKRHFNTYPKYPQAQQAFSILESARDDIRNDALFEIKQITAAEVFDEFLEQGSALLAAGYMAPAAVVIGAVLEDGLRKLCAKMEIALPDKAKLDFMNSALAKAGVYSVLTQKKMTALADIRNSAAHGNWDKFEASDVENMLQWTNDFMQNYFS